jgi:hypothetical protein
LSQSRDEELILSAGLGGAGLLRPGRKGNFNCLTVTEKSSFSSNIEPLARALDSFVLMYQNHTAREDTIVFPAWKNTVTEGQLHEMGEKFKDIEHQVFGRDGYEDAVIQIGQIERALGLADIAQFTASLPPKL